MMADEANDASTKAMPAPSIYNAVFEFYVGELTDAPNLLGLVAYGLYKRQKREWFVAARARKSGSSPSAAEVDAFTLVYLTEDMRTTLLDRASEILTRYGTEFLEGSKHQIVERALSQEMLRQARDIESALRNKDSIGRQVLTGLIATMIWTVVLTILVIAAALTGSDLVDAFTALTRR